MKRISTVKYALLSTDDIKSVVSKNGCIKFLRKPDKQQHYIMSEKRDNLDPGLLQDLINNCISTGIILTTSGYVKD